MRMPLGCRWDAARMPLGETGYMGCRWDANGMPTGCRWDANGMPTGYNHERDFVCQSGTGRREVIIEFSDVTKVSFLPNASLTHLQLVL